MRVYDSLANPDYIAAPFVEFSSINSHTNLETLNLNWRERDLPEKQRTKHVHRLHPYLGKFVPQLVEIFLRKFRPSSVYDPFCGSGTTLVEANALGIDSIGCDISAFNCLVSRAKTAKYDLSIAKTEILGALRELDCAFSPNLFEMRADEIREGNDYLNDWFHPDALRALLIYRSLIRSYQYQDLLRVILSRSARSARLTTHHHLDFPKKPQRAPYSCRKHDRICQPTADARQFLRRYSLDTISRVAAFDKIRTSADIKIVWDDAKSVRLPRFDMIMTSPPYVGLIDYHEQHRYAYELLDLPQRQQEEIGAAFKGKSRKAHEDYLNDIKAVLANARRHLNTGGVAVIVVGDKEGLYTDQMASELDFRPTSCLSRHVNRRTGRRNGDFFENVLIWKAR